MRLRDYKARQKRYKLATSFLSHLSFLPPITVCDEHIFTRPYNWLINFDDNKLFYLEEHFITSFLLLLQHEAYDGVIWI